MKTLDSASLLIYNKISSQEKGISEKQLKKEVGKFPTLKNKIRKLVNCGLIKSFRSFREPLNKHYISFKQAPPKDLQGGFWFAGTNGPEGDVGAIESMGKIIRGLRRNKNNAFAWAHQGFTSKQLLDFVTEKKVFRTDYKIDVKDIEDYLRVKVYDNILMESTSGKYYFVSTSTKWKKEKNEPIQYAMSTPCGPCKVRSLCTSGGVISPQNCEYLEAWLLDW